MGCVKKWLNSGWIKSTKEGQIVSNSFVWNGCYWNKIIGEYMQTARPYIQTISCGRTDLRCKKMSFKKEKTWGIPMLDHFLSLIVFCFKALFLKILKFQLCRHFSLRPHDEFSWDEEQILPNLCIYGPKSCNFKVFLCKYLFHAKNPKH